MQGSLKLTGWDVSGIVLRDDWLNVPPFPNIMADEWIRVLRDEGASVRQFCCPAMNKLFERTGITVQGSFLNL